MKGMPYQNAEREREREGRAEVEMEGNCMEDEIKE
jgi:hypothetical protein